MKRSCSCATSGITVRRRFATFLQLPSFFQPGAGHEDGRPRDGRPQHALFRPQMATHRRRRRWRGAALAVTRRHRVPTRRPAAARLRAEALEPRRVNPLHVAPACGVAQEWPIDVCAAKGHAQKAARPLHDRVEHGARVRLQHAADSVAVAPERRATGDGNGRGRAAEGEAGGKQFVRGRVAPRVPHLLVSRRDRPTHHVARWGFPARHRVCGSYAPHWNATRIESAPKPVGN